jgi:hypothetical protein
MFNEPMTAFGNAVERRLPAERHRWESESLGKRYHGSFSSQVLLGLPACNEDGSLKRQKRTANDESNFRHFCHVRVLRQHRRVRR